MALGRKTGGRVAGTPNKRTQEVMERLDALGCDPIEGMAKIAMDRGNPPELRGRMFAELATLIKATNGASVSANESCDATIDMYQVALSLPGAHRGAAVHWLVSEK